MIEQRKTKASRSTIEQCQLAGIQAFYFKFFLNFFMIIYFTAFSCKKYYNHKIMIILFFSEKVARNQKYSTIKTTGLLKIF